MNVTTIIERIGRHLNLDPEDFAAALTVQHLTLLLVHGGSAYERPDAQDALDPLPLETFLDRAVVTAQRVGRLAPEWLILQHLFRHLKRAWEEEQTLFQVDLRRAKRSKELLEYFSVIDFAVDCFASLTAMNAYPGDCPAQAWALNGYMVAGESGRTMRARHPKPDRDWRLFASPDWGTQGTREEYARAADRVQTIRYITGGLQQADVLTVATSRPGEGSDWL